MQVCPRCSYRRGERDVHVHAGICPSCGIAYAKFRPLADTGTPGRQEVVDDTPRAVEADDSRPGERFSQRLVATLLWFREPVDPTIVAIKAAFVAGLTVWGLSFVVGGIDWESIGGSFLHNANLPFHEFGHVLFSPLGRFMGILGGSLFQVLLPLILAAAFVVKQQDNFGGAVCLWWCGQNLIDVSPYIADAPYRALPLIRGMDESAHDWGNLLSMTGSMDSAGFIAGVAFTLGTLVMAVALGWAGRLLWLQYKVLQQN